MTWAVAPKRFERDGASSTNFQVVTGIELLDVLEQCLRRRAVPERQEAIERLKVHLSPKTRILEYHLDLRTEREHPVLQRVIERLHAEVIARKHQAPVSFVENRD